MDRYKVNRYLTILDLTSVSVNKILVTEFITVKLSPWRQAIFKTRIRRMRTRIRRMRRTWWTRQTWRIRRIQRIWRIRQIQWIWWIAQAIFERFFSIIYSATKGFISSSIYLLRYSQVITVWSTWYIYIYIYIFMYMIYIMIYI